MTQKFTILAVLIALFSVSVKAQIGVWMPDTAVVGANAENDVFYSLPQGKIRTESNKNYLLAFETKKFSAGVWANHGDTLVVYSTTKNFSSWNTITLADTISKLYNSDTSWGVGALNQVSPGGFSYGWGTYNPSTHNLYGDTVFILKKYGMYFKMYIDSMVGTTNDWTVRLGYLSFPGDTVFKFTKSPMYDSNNFIYLAVSNMGQFSTPVREPDTKKWDMLFTNYSTITSGQRRNNVGLLTNYGVSSTRIQAIDPNSIATNYNTYTSGLNSKINNIGWDWKIFDFTNSTYIIDTMNSYLIRSRTDSAYYLIRFKYYSGGAQLASNGTIAFEKMQLNWPTSVSDYSQVVNKYLIYPNPANNNVIIALESKQNTDASIIITDVLGRTVYDASIRIVEGLNAYDVSTQKLNSGNYFVKIAGEKININKQITVQH